MIMAVPPSASVCVMEVTVDYSKLISTFEGGDPPPHSKLMCQQDAALCYTSRMRLVACSTLLCRSLGSASSSLVESIAVRDLALTTG